MEILEKGQKICVGYKDIQSKKCTVCNGNGTFGLWTIFNNIKIE